MQWRSVPIQTSLPPDARRGEHPLEFVWANRKESPQAQIWFGDLDGWTMQVQGDADVSLGVSAEELAFREQVAKFTYNRGGGKASVMIRPPQPVTFESPFDAANLWVCGGSFVDYRGQDAATPALTVHLTDAAGKAISIPLGSLASHYWDLRHGLLPRDHGGFPMRFEALEISSWDVAGDRFIYLESLALYMQNRKPPPYVRPRGVKFPVSDSGMLPTPVRGARVTVRRVGSGADFICETGGGTLRYRVRPEEGALHGVTARWNEGRMLRPMDGGGIRLDSGGAEPDCVPDLGKVARSELTGGRLIVTWRHDQDGKAVEWQTSYWLNGRTLVVDVACKGGDADGLTYGDLTGLTAPRRFTVPYFVIKRDGSMIEGPFWACGDGLFVSVLPDLFHSDFSTPQVKPSPMSARRVGLMGGTTYAKLSDGRRNNLRERILVSISPEFTDTLPNSQAPRSPNYEKLAPYMNFLTYDVYENFLQTIKRYGIDNVVAHDFAMMYTYGYPAHEKPSEPDWCMSARWRPRPPMTIETMQRRSQFVKSLGYLYGAYFYTISTHVYNEFFDEDEQSLGKDGNWRAGIGSQVTPKPSATVRITREVGRKFREYYDSDSAYVDIGACIDANAIDFEAGAPGAGMARETILQHGDSLAEAQKWFGGNTTEGYLMWLYGGLGDAHYGTPVYEVPYPNEAPYFGMDPEKIPGRADFPPLVDFDLLKIHPVTHGLMMGFCPYMALSRADWYQLYYDDKGVGLAPIGFYKWLALSLTYGRMAMLGYDYIPPLSRCLQLNSLMVGVQQEYLTDQAAEISYHNGTEFVGVSQALLQDTLKTGRVRVRYSRGLTVLANCSMAGNWTVELDGRTYELPPYGWVASKPGKVLGFSALVNGTRLDYVQRPDYVYINTNGVPAREGPVELNGAVLLKRQEGGWRVIPCGDFGKWEKYHPEGWAGDLWDVRLCEVPPQRGCSAIVLDAHALLGKAAAEVSIEGRDESGKAPPLAATAADGARLELTPSAAIADYVLR